MRIALMCPRCGLLRFVDENDNSSDFCEYCHTKTTQFDINEADFDHATQDEADQLREKAWRKFLYNNPQFDEELFEKRIKDIRDFMRGVSERVSKLPKCPTCQSTDITPISGLERGASVLALGLFSKKINKSFKCNKCGYTW